MKKTSLFYQLISRVDLFHRFHRSTYFTDLPAFDELNLATLSAKMNDRTNKLSFGANQKTNTMQN